jgi:hypothetical protein
VAPKCLGEGNTLGMVDKTHDTRLRAADQRVVAAAVRHLRLYGFVPTWHSLEAAYRPYMTARELARAWLDGRI